MTKGNIFLIPTYLSETNDKRFISPMVTDIIQNLNQFLVENVRTARRFISSLNLNIDIETLQFEVIDKNTSMIQVHQIMKKYQNQDMGLLSEAGLPCLADPGNLAVAFAHQHQMKIISLPGASAIQSAIMCSGFNGQQFVFHGYAPIQKDDLVRFIKNIVSDLQKNGYTQAFMETPYRNMKLLESLIQYLPGNTLLSISADISGENEMIETKTIKEWSKNMINIHKVPAVFCIGNFPE